MPTQDMIVADITGYVDTNHQFIHRLWPACATEEDGAERARQQHDQRRITMIMRSTAIIGMVSTKHAELLIFAAAATTTMTSGTPLPIWVMGG